MFSGELQSKNFELVMSILRHRRENYESCFCSLGLNREFVANVITFLRSYTFSQVNLLIINCLSTFKAESY